MELGRHFRSATEHAAYAQVLERYLFTKSLQKLGSREQTANIIMRAKQRQTLFDDVLLVLLGHRRLPHFQQLDNPPRIEIHHKTNAAPILSQMFYGKAQTPGTSWSKR